MKIKSIFLSLLLLPISTLIKASFVVNNNYNYATATVTVDFTGGSLTYFSWASISAWDSATVNNTSGGTPTKISVDNAYGPNNNGNFTITPSSTATSVNIYTNQVLTNNYNGTLTVRCYNSGGNETGAMPINAHQTLQFVSGTISIGVFDSTNSIVLTPQTNVAEGTSYGINYNGSVYSIASYTPTLTNNTSQNQTISNLYFYDSNNVQINSSAITINPGNTVNVNGQAATYQFTAYNTTLLAQTFFPTENIFTANYIENNSSENITVNYGGTINGNSSTRLNQDQISIALSAKNQIITGTTSFTAFDNSGAKITFSDGSTAVAMSSGFNYYISLQNGVWSYSTTNSPFNLTNNSGADISSITFYVSGTTTSLGTISPLNNNKSTPIPNGAGYAEYIININGVNQFPNPQVSDSANSNIMTGQFVYNNSTTPIYVTYNYSSLIGYFELTAAGSGTSNFGILTGTTSISVSTTNSSSGNVITGYPISSGNSYYLNQGSDGNWVITTDSTIYTLTNNGTTSATNVKFFNTNNTQQGSTISTLASSDAATIPATNPVYATLTQVINGTSTNITVPVSSTSDSRTFGTYTMTNLTTSTVYVRFYGTINGVANTSMNSVVIPITASGYCNLIIPATSVDVYTNSTGTTLLFPTTNISGGQSYFINIDAVSSYQEYFLTNNSTIATGPITFYDVNIVGSASNIPASGAVAIPATATFGEFFVDINGTNSTINTIVSDTANSKIYTDQSIYNNTGQTIYIAYNNESLTSYFKLTPSGTNNFPFVTGATSFTASLNSNGSTPFISNYPVDAGLSYYINYTNNTYSVTTSSSEYTLTNDGTTSATNLKFYNSDNVQQGNTVSTLAANSTAVIPATNPVSAAFNQTINGTNTNVIVPVSSTNNSSIFGSYTITNSSASTVYVKFYATINGVANSQMNTTAIAMAPAAVCSLIVPASLVNVYSDANATTLLISSAIVGGQSYFINSGPWAITTTSLQYLTNNYSTATTTPVDFYNTSNAFISASGSTLSANGGSAPIPAAATYASFYQSINGAATMIINSAVVDTISSNFYSGKTITNSTSSTIYVIYYGNLHTATTPPQLMNENPIPIISGATAPIISGATQFTISPNSNGSSPVITAYTVASGLSYFINDNSSTWSVTTTQPSSSLTNNGLTNATNLQFFNTGGVQQGNTATTLASSGIATIPATNPVYATFNQLINSTSTNLTIPVSSTNSSAIFGTYTITNTAASTVYLKFFATINGVTNTLMNSAAIPVTALTGTCNLIVPATSVSVYSDAGATTLLVTSVIGGGQSYFINQDGSTWDIASYQEYFLTNNLSVATGSLTFYNSAGGPVGTVSNIPAGGATAIPTSATFGEFFLDINGVTTTVNAVVSDATNSNIYTNQYMNNNTNGTIYVAYEPNLTTFFKLTPTGANSVPFVTGTTSFTASLNSDGSSPFISNYTVQSGNSYYINYSSGTYSVTTSSTNYSLINNGSSSATSVVFKNSSGTQQGSTVATLTATSSTVIPDTNSTTATLTQSINSTSTSIIVPLPGTINANIYTPYLLHNTTASTIYIICYGPINGVSNQQMNTVAYPITAVNGTAPIITPATLIKVYSNAGATNLVYSFSINGGSDYYINYSNSTWSDSELPVNYNFTNNYSTATGTVNFYNVSANFVSSIPGLSANGGYGAIESSATYAQFTQTINGTAGTIKIPVSDSANSNIDTGQTVQNDAGAGTIWINFYGTINSVPNVLLNTAPIQITNGNSAPIITGATSFSIYSPNSTTPTIIVNEPISASTNYFVQAGFVVTTSVTVYKFKNNYSTNATAVTFYDQSNTQQGATVSPLNAGDKTVIPTPTCTYVELTQLIHSTTANIAVPLLADSTVDCYTNYTLNNSSSETVYVVYRGNVDNGGTNPKNLVDPSTAIDITAGASCPIITGASSVNVYSNAGATNLLESFTISNNSNYYITENNGNWSYSATYPFTLTNNSTAATGTITFLNNSTTISTVDSLAGWKSISIPVGTTSIVMEGLYNSVGTTNITFTCNIPANQYINIYNNFVLLNFSTSPVLVECYQSDQSTVAGYFELLSGQKAQIVFGTAYVKILNITGTTTLISTTDIATSSSYKISDEGSWTLTEYTPQLVNNSPDKSSASIALSNSNNQEITNGYSTLGYGDNFNIRGDASYATVLYPYGTVYIPMTLEPSENVFTPYTIYNNSSQSVQATFEGSLNGSAATYGISTPITIAANSAINIITGAENVLLNANSTTIGSSPNALARLTSYIISYDSTTATWSFAPTQPYLVNNCNRPLIDLIFYNASSVQIGLPSSLIAYGAALIPTLATYATFTQFGTLITIPVSYAASSNIYLPYQITNDSTTETAVITFNTGIATFVINLAPLASMPIFTSTTSFFVNPNLTKNAPYTHSYDITYISPDWSITNQPITLTNNSDVVIATLSFYDSVGALITDFTDVQPWQNKEIPTTAMVAIAGYPDYIITTIVSDQQSSRIFTHNTLNNNYGESIYVNYYGYLDGASNTLLNDTPILIETGQSSPFITGAHSVSIMTSAATTFSVPTDLVTIISNAPISSSSYKVPSLPTLRRLSSALTTMRLLGGSIPVPPYMPAANIYGYNSNLFTEFLYVDTYAQLITDPIARAQTVTTVNDILAQYGVDYIVQPNFNYLSYLYLINEELDAAEQDLITAHLESLEEIEQFFIYLKKHAANLLR